MKKLTKAEQKTLIKLLERAVENGQLDLGVNVSFDDELETYGHVDSNFDVVDYTAFDDGVPVGVYMKEQTFKSLRGTINRMKAVSRKLDSKTASEMAKKRHAKK